MERAMARDNIDTNDRQLACARINSQEGQDYLKAMACAANFAWVNRSSMTFLVRQAFAKMFKTTPDDLDMHLVYDVSHNIAKVQWMHSDTAERYLMQDWRSLPEHLINWHPRYPSCMKAQHT